MPAKSLAEENPAAMDNPARVNDDGSISINANAVTSVPDAGFQWETAHVEAPTQITFDTLGDTFIGLYISKEEIEFQGKKGTEDFTQLRFLVGDEPYAINAGYDLVRGFKNIPTGVYVRIQLRKLVDVGQQTPLKSYRVDVAPNPSNSVTAASQVHALRGNRDATPVEPPF